MTDESLYEVLGLDEDATLEEIREAYRKLAQQWHPDKHGGSAEATARFQRINEAYQTLADEAKRQRYDDTGRIEAGEKGDDVTEAAITVLLRFTMQAMQDPRAEFSNLREMAERYLRNTRVDQESSISENRQKIRRFNSLAKRWKRAGRGPNIFVNALRREVRALKVRIKTAEQALEIGVRALEILGDYSFEHEGAETVAERERRIGATVLLSGWPDAFPRSPRAG